MTENEYTYLITINTGLEDIAAKEFKQLGAKVIETHRSRVIVKSDFEFIFRVNYLSRTAHKAFLIILEGTDIQSLDDVVRVTRQIEYSDYLSLHLTFAVRFERIGEHDFTSLDMNAAVGSVIVEYFLKTTGKRIRANLNKPIVEFGGWLIQDRLIFGINTSGSSLHMRGYRKFQHPAPLKPTIASSLLYMSRWFLDQNLILLDPMCGSGTILIEAALIGRSIPPGYFRDSFSFENFIFIDQSEFQQFKESINSKIEWNKMLKLYGIDKNKNFIEGSIVNAKNANVADTIIFKHGDARCLRKYVDVIPDVVIVNPPYGYRMNAHSWVKKLYADFIKSLIDLNPKVELIAMTADKEMERVASKYFNLVDKKVTIYGHLSTLVYRFEPK